MKELTVSAGFLLAISLLVGAIACPKSPDSSLCKVSWFYVRILK